MLHRLGATDDGDKLTTPGRQMAALGCEPRLAAMLVTGAALSADGLATAALLAALLEEPPRGGQMDIGYWLSRPQPNWRSVPRSWPNACRNVRGKSTLIWRRACWRRRLPIVSPSAEARTAATYWPTVWGRR